MRGRLHEFGTEVDVWIVSFTGESALADYRARSGVDLPILLDPDRAAYRAFGLGRGSLGRVWGWRAAKRYLEIIRADGVVGLRRPTEDTLQLGGDFVVGPDGILHFGHWGAGPDDRPDVEALIDATRHT